MGYWQAVIIGSAANRPIGQIGQASKQAGQVVRFSNLPIGKLAANWTKSANWTKLANRPDRPANRPIWSERTIFLRKPTHFHQFLLDFWAVTLKHEMQNDQFITHFVNKIRRSSKKTIIARSLSWTPVKACSDRIKCVVLKDNRLKTRIFDFSLHYDR